MKILCQYSNLIINQVSQVGVEQCHGIKKHYYEGRYGISILKIFWVPL